jgi:hypothetical protein
MFTLAKAKLMPETVLRVSENIDENFRSAALKIQTTEIYDISLILQYN